MDSKLRYANRIATNEGESTELFASFFCADFCESSDDAPMTNFLATDLHDSFNITLTYDEVLNGFSAIDCTKGSGQDDIHPLVLKMCTRTLASPIHEYHDQRMQAQRSS